MWSTATVNPGNMPSAHAEDLLEWKCRFCRVGVGQVNKCTTIVGPTYLQIKWWTFPSPMQRERKLHAHNILRASISFEPRLRVTVHVLTTPDANGDSEYKTYEFTDFTRDDESDTFAAAVNAIAFSERPLAGRVLVFVNPVSGSRSGPKRFKAVEPLFHLVGLECEVVTTTHHGHAADVIAAANLDLYSAILSVSGDGTLQEVFTGLISRADSIRAVTMPVGIIPAGSEGTLAKISTYFNPFAAAYVILKSHEVRPLDVLKLVQGTQTIFSVCGVGWGMPGKVAEESEQLRSTYGRSRYAVSALKEFVNFRGCPGVLEVLPAKERPLCSCGPGCLRCRSGADLAKRNLLIASQCQQQNAQPQLPGPISQGSMGQPLQMGGDERPGMGPPSPALSDGFREPENVPVFSMQELDEHTAGFEAERGEGASSAFDGEGAGGEAGASLAVMLPPCAAHENTESGDAASVLAGAGKVEWEARVKSSSITTRDGESSRGRGLVQGPPTSNRRDKKKNSAGKGGGGMEGSSMSAADVSSSSDDGAGALNVSGSGSSSGGGGVVVVGNSTVSPLFAAPQESTAEQGMVVLDYDKRIKGLGDAADRGSALLLVAEKWRESEEESLIER